MTRLIIVRHGQTEWNRVERYRGRADIPLNETGLQQAQAAARRIAAAWTVQAVYHSPLARAQATASAIAVACHAPLLAHEALIDVDYGAWTGLSPDEALARFPDVAATWKTKPSAVLFPGGESLAGVRGRAVACMESLVDRHSTETIVLVSHVVVCRLLVLAALGLDSDHFWRIRQENAAINVFESDAGIYTIAALNDCCHLAGG
jgi:probable phosphoglycerate mutase